MEFEDQRDRRSPETRTFDRKWTEILKNEKLEMKNGIFGGVRRCLKPRTRNHPDPLFNTSHGPFSCPTSACRTHLGARG